ncbi:MAG: peptide deformylase [Candidatus Colwellbacteria bacterium]|nr:peptide deformylase [Candidatus Colwellbacteria bacterium]
MRILKITNKGDQKILRRKTTNFDFKKFTANEIRDLIKKMRVAMEEANGIGLAANQMGIGLAANQMGLDMKVFVAQVGGKFYAVFNPEIVKISKETEAAVEGCLSVPETTGEVTRPYRITLKGFDKKGKRITIRAWNHLARVFQHEVDHLNGVLFIDRIDKKSSK